MGAEKAFLGAGQWVYDHVKAFSGLKIKLERARMEQSPVEFLSEWLLSAIMFSIMAFIGVTIAYQVGGKQDLMWMSPIIAGVVFTLWSALYLNQPSYKIKNRAKEIEKRLSWALEAMAIQIASGKPLINTMDDLANENYGPLSDELQWAVNQVNTGENLNDVMEELAMANPGPYFQKTMWTLENAQKAGGEVSEGLSDITQELSRDQEIEARRYGQKLNPLTMMYLLTGLVVPALGITLLLVLSSMPGVGGIITESIYWAIIGFSGVMQLLFIFIIKTAKPPILEELGSEKEDVGTRKGLKGVYDKIAALVTFAGIETPPKKYILQRVVASIILSVIVTYIVLLYTEINTIAIFMLSMITFVSLIYGRLNLKADSRGDHTAEFLPYVLQQTSSNIKAGMTTIDALMASGREEFGTLAEEISIVGKKVGADTPLDDALNEIKYRIKSSTLDLSIDLVRYGIQSGRGLAAGLDRISTRLSERLFIKKEIRANISMNLMLIAVMILFGAPILFGIGNHFAKTLNHMMAMTKGGLPDEILDKTMLGSTESNISTEFIDQVSLVGLAFAGIFGSLMIGQLNKGKALSGINYIIPLTLIPIALFFIVQKILERVLGGMLGI